MTPLDFTSSLSSEALVLERSRARYRNKIRGTVISIRHDLRWVTVGLATEENLPLNIRWRTPANVAPNVQIGEQLLASLRSDQVLLGSDHVWPGPLAGSNCLNESEE